MDVKEFADLMDAIEGKNNKMENKQLDNESLKEQYSNMRERYVEIQQQMLEKKSSWIRFLVTVMSAVLGILASFGRPEKDADFLANCFFIVGFISLAIGIVLSIICLYSDINLSKKALEQIRDEAIKAFEGRRGAKTVQPHPCKAFRICGIAGFSFFVLSLISLCVFMMMILK